MVSFSIVNFLPHKVKTRHLTIGPLSVFCMKIWTLKFVLSDGKNDFWKKNEKVDFKEKNQFHKVKMLDFKEKTVSQSKNAVGSKCTNSTAR